MELRELESLRAVRAHGGVIRAAEVLRLTPSAVSQQLGALQREAGVQLTQRVGRSLRLTPAGEALADAAVDVAVALERARAACQTFLARPQGTVSVSAFQSAAQLLFPPLLDRVAGLGGLIVRCSDEDVAQRDFAALTDQVDIVIAHRPAGGADWAAAGVAVREFLLMREPLDVAVALDHPLAGRSEVRPEDLGDQSWITVREGFPVAAVLDAVAARSDSAPRIIHRINDFHVIEAMVAAGHGVSLLPRYTFRHAANLRLLQLAGVRAERRVDALVRPDRAERLAVRRVLGALVDIAAGVSAPQGGARETRSG